MGALRIPQSGAQPARDNSKNRGATGLWIPGYGRNMLGITRPVVVGSGMSIGYGVDGKAWVGTASATSQVDPGVSALDLGISGNASRTIVAYFRPTLSSASGNGGTVWGVGGGGANSRDFALRQVDDTGGPNGWRIQMWGAEDLDFQLPNTAGTLRAVVVTYDGTTNRVYDSQSSTPSTPIASKAANLNTYPDQNFLIGRWTFNNASMYGFQGQIYLVETIARVWTPDEIADFFRNPGQLVEPLPSFPYAAAVANATPATDTLGAGTTQSNTTGVGTVPTGTWTMVAGGESGSMTFGSPTYTRYGADVRWAYFYGVGTVTFSNAEFGDPASGVPKNGYYFTASAGTNNLTGTTTIQAAVSGTGVVNTSSTIKNLTGATSTQVNTSATSLVAIGGNTKVLTGAATTQSAISSTTAVQLYVANAPEPVIPLAFGDWLKSQTAIRCVLIEVVAQVNGVETTRYLSNKTYVTGAGDSPANTAYVPAVAGGVEFTEKLSLDGTPSLSYGDIELFNINGERDGWLNDIWRNRSIKVYMGDVTWARSQFVMIFNGLVFDVDTRTRDRINLKLTDKFQRLNNPITEKKLGGTSQSKDTLIPLCFGECFNVSPLLTNAATLEYQVHDGAIERIIEVRDNGVPVSFTEFVATGKFKLNQSPVGTITCSVQGDKYLSYITDIGSIVERVVTGFGLAGQRFTGADIDATKLAAFKAANTAPVGIYINDRTNVLDVCNKLASSVGARVAMSRGGLMYLIKIDVPRSDAGTTVTASDMKERSLSITQLPDVVAGVKLGYAKNWTLEANIQTGIPADHVTMFAQDWLTVTSTDSTVATLYNLFTDPVMQETLLLRGTDATTECNRRLAMYKTQRKVIQYEGYPQLLTEVLGNTQTIKHPRFGLANGSAGQIISIQSDWLNPKVTMEVLI